MPSRNPKALDRLSSGSERSPHCILCRFSLILTAPVHLQVDTLSTEALKHFLYCWKGHGIVALALFAT